MRPLSPTLLSNANPDPGWKGRVTSHPMADRPFQQISRILESYGSDGVTDCHA